MIRLIVADDHVMFREALKVRLDNENDMEVVGDCSYARDLLRLAGDRQFDLVLVDVEMPGNPLQAVRELLRNYQGVRVIACSPYCADNIIARCLQAGVHGIVLKTQNTAALLEAIRAVASGGQYYAAEVRDRLQFSDGRPCDAGDGAGDGGKPQTRLSQLTRRELEVIRLLAQGQSLKQVAQSLYVSYKTVDSHTYNLMRKLGLRNRAELVHYAIREKVVSVEVLDADPDAQPLSGSDALTDPNS